MMRMVNGIEVWDFSRFCTVDPLTFMYVKQYMYL